MKKYLLGNEKRISLRILTQKTTVFIKRLDELTARLTALAQEYKQIKLSIVAKNPPQKF
jgi:hypothetical protein